MFRKKNYTILKLVDNKLVLKTDKKHFTISVTNDVVEYKILSNDTTSVQTVGE